MTFAYRHPVSLSLLAFYLLVGTILQVWPWL